MSLRLLCFYALLLETFSSVAHAQETRIHYLSGTDKDHRVDWTFFCTAGRKSGYWTSIPVPSQWEQEGFGNYAYGTQRDKTTEAGIYKYSFQVPLTWRRQYVEIVFEGVMTDALVKINGRQAGPLHQGGFYRFHYNISGLLRYGKTNTLEVEVHKQSANASVELAERKGDFWTFGGIYRPVYLRIKPAVHVEDLAIRAEANGDLQAQVYTRAGNAKQRLRYQLETIDGQDLGPAHEKPLADTITISEHYDGVKSWNPENPVLYQWHVSIVEGDKIIHSVRRRIGFRTAEMRAGDGFYVNGVKVIFKGVNRHSEWPESGRTLSRDIHLMDIGLIKDMNMNAVRMSHYPPDEEFLDLCDSLGLFVLDELTGWQHAYDTVVGRKLVKEMVERDRNHPSIVIWDNGNEGGWNRALDTEFGKYDLQHRFVMHPWEKFNGTDTKHYPDFNYVANKRLYGNDIFYPTEFMHGLYDGGQGAALEDFWNEMMLYPHFAGGFLWSFHDEGIVRTDQGGKIDTYRSSAPDGIVGPHREKEGSYYAVKEIWSPVIIHNQYIPQPFNGRIQVENAWLFTNLKECYFIWKTLQLPAPDSRDGGKIIASGRLQGPDMQPGEKGWIHISPDAVNNRIADLLELAVYDAKGHLIVEKRWPLKSTQEFNKSRAQGLQDRGRPVLEQSEHAWVVKQNQVDFIFDPVTGRLKEVHNSRGKISFGDGPVLFDSVKIPSRLLASTSDSSVQIEVDYNTKDPLQLRWTFATGQLPMLEYKYEIRGAQDFLGIGFHYPEEKIKGMRWMGQGPYRVWKNRLQGMNVGVWQKDYNNTVTGESWDYPEFKGWHGNLYWVRVENSESDFTIYSGTDHLFLQMLKPQPPAGAYNDNTSPPFPSYDIGFMHAISPIGTKFQAASLMGPSSQQNMLINKAPLEGKLWFDFSANN